VLVAADVGTRIVMNSTTDATITVNTSLFAAGDTLWIHDIGAGNCTIVAGTCAVTTSSSLVVPTNGGGYLYFTSASTAIFFATGNINQTLPLSNRNTLINGMFNIWQRGTSKAMATGAGTGYLADRWNAVRATFAAGGTVSRQTASLDGFQYCSRVQRDSGNTGTSVIFYFQTLESANCVPLINKTVSYSFYIRAGANLSGSVVAKLYSGTATDQGNYPENAITGSATVITSTLSLTTSWQRVTLSGTVGASAAQLFAGFEWTPVGTAGAADYFEITGVQVEAGSVATPFEFEDISTTLAKCQRYLPAWIGTSNQALGVSANTSNTRVTVPFLVTPRVAPTGVTVSSLSHFGLNNPGLTSGTPTAISFVFAGTSSAVLGVDVAVGSPTIATCTTVQFSSSSGSALLLFTGSEL
jgi:hypothetical protein